MSAETTIKDYLLKRETLSFSIDEIYPVSLGKDFREDVYGLRVIPDMNSEYFPPFHLRNIRVRPALLQQAYYDTVIRNNRLDRGISNLVFSGSVVQGGYYSIPTRKLPYNVFKEEVVLDIDTDVFNEYIQDSPYKKYEINDKTLNIENDSELDLQFTNIIGVNQKALYIYCFNVGQGDSSLIITPNSNAYLVDVNLYGTQELNTFIFKLQQILSLHNMPTNRLTALIITHKHLDHIRGADQFILSGKFHIDHFMINLDYCHDTQAVERLMNAANNVPVWVNMNRKGKISDGNVMLCIKNPDRVTSTNYGAPDINDSSICLCVRYESNLAYFTGDASFSIINHQYMCNRLSKLENFLKVSHHGSRTGTDSMTVTLLNPSHAFISCGESANFQHPHNETKSLLSTLPDLKVSKKIAKTVKYTMNGNRITSDIMSI